MRDDRFDVGAAVLGHVLTYWLEICPVVNQSLDDS
jgi:hypothetical protein